MEEEEVIYHNTNIHINQATINTDMLYAILLIIIII